MAARSVSTACLLARKVERRCGAIARPRFHHLEHPFRNHEILTRRRNASAQRQYLEIAARHTRDQRKSHRFPIEARGAQRRFGRAHAGRVSSPQIDLVRRGEGGNGGILARPASPLHTRFAECGGGTEIQCRKERRARDTHLRLRLANVLRCDRKVGICAEGGVDELRQFCGAETIPPVSREHHRIRGARLGPREWHGRPAWRRLADGRAGAQADHGKRGHDGYEVPHHPFASATMGSTSAALRAGM